MRTLYKPHLQETGCCVYNNIILFLAAPSHSGTYTVKAENAGGEAECIADFIVLEAEPQTEQNLQMMTHVTFKNVREETIQVRLVTSQVNVVCVIITPLRLYFTFSRYGMKYVTCVVDGHGTCVISGIHCGLNEVLALLGCYTSYSGSDRCFGKICLSHLQGMLRKNLSVS
jgi:hypothetical protein